MLLDNDLALKTGDHAAPSAFKRVWDEGNWCQMGSAVYPPRRMGKGA